MQVVIRDFEPDDQDAARAVIQTGLAERWGDAYDPAANPDTDDLGASYGIEGRCLVVAVEGSAIDADDDAGDVVGIGALVTEAPGVARIVRLSVSPRHRRRGVASTLLADLMARARSRGDHAVVVSTDTPWIDAIALYRKAGFAVTAVDQAETHLRLDLVWTDDQLETTRLNLRAPTIGDNAFAVELLTDEDTRVYLGGPASFAVVEWVKAHSLAPQWGTFVIWHRSVNDDGAPQRLGMVELEDWRGELEISCHLLPEFWGQGYAAEASTAVLAWAAANRDDESIIAVTHADNTAAQSVLGRLGFEPDSTFVEHGDPQLQMRRPLRSDLAVTAGR